MSRRTLKKQFRHWFHRKMDNAVRSNMHRRVMKATIIIVCLIISAILGWLVYNDSP
ncbi:MAG: hypothetical protein VB980_06495 [Opitutales bacterium]